MGEHEGLSQVTLEQVIAEVAELRGSITTFMENWCVQDERAAASRRELYQKLTDVQVAQAALIRQVAELTQTVAKQEPKISALESAYDKGWGIIWLGRIVFGVVFAAIVWIVDHFWPLVVKGK